MTVREETIKWVKTRLDEERAKLLNGRKNNCFEWEEWYQWLLWVDTGVAHFDTDFPCANCELQGKCPILDKDNNCKKLSSYHDIKSGSLDEQWANEEK